MKRLFILLITLLLVFVQASAWTNTYAIAEIPVSCAVNQYSVDRITGRDQFTRLGCFEETQFQEAYAFMLSEAAKAPNVVLRHAESNSPMNIVAADRAMAYSQNHTYLRSDTMNIWRNAALTQAFTFINQSNPLYYYTTVIKSKASTEIIKPSDLAAEIEVNGARGFVELNGIDIIPLIYVENRANNWLITFTTRNSLNNTLTGHLTRPNITQYRVSDVTSTTKAGNITVRQIAVQVHTALRVDTYTYGNAPDWLPVGTYFSPDGIVFYTDMDLKNPVRVNGVVGRYYNYYKYLNLRTVTQYTAQELDEYFNFFFAVNRLDPNSSVMKDKGSAFVNAQNLYGMNALLIYAMAIHESAYGRSSLAVNRFNLFGYGAFDSNPSNAFTFRSVEHAVDEHMGINLRHYLDFSNFNAATNTSLFYGSNIGNKGAGINTRYASDPWWSIKIAGFAYRIDRYLGFKDLNRYQIAILKPDATRSVFTNTSLNTVLYSINERATNYPLTITATTGDVLFVPSTNPIINAALITGSTRGLVPYNTVTSIGFINRNQVDFVNIPRVNPIVINSEDTLLTYVTNWEWLGNDLYVKGWAALSRTNMNLGAVTHQVNAINLDDETLRYTFNMNIASADYVLNIGNGFDYSRAWFDGIIDVSSLPEGNFRFEIVTKSGETSGTTALRNPSIDAPRTPIKVDENGYFYRFSFNNRRRMRFELAKELGIVVEGLSPLLPSRFNSTGYFTEFKVEDGPDNRLLIDLKGIAFIQNASTGINDQVSHQLLLLSSSGVQHTFNLTTSTGQYDLSNRGFDYSHAWFTGVDIDVTALANDTYRIFVVTTTKDFKDLVEVRDILFANNQQFESNTKKFLLQQNANVRRRYSLTISDKSVTTP